MGALYVVALVILAVIGAGVVLIGGVLLWAAEQHERERAGRGRIADDQRARGATSTFDVDCPEAQAAAGLRVGGPGVLAVFDTMIEFALLRPQRVLTIPRAAITSVTAVAAIDRLVRRRPAGPPFVIVEWGDGRVVELRSHEAEVVRATITGTPIAEDCQGSAVPSAPCSCRAIAPSVVPPAPRSARRARRS